MCHFYANPLSILLANADDLESILIPLLQSEHAEAIRMLPSFKAKIELLAEAGDVEELREYMNSDEELVRLTVKSLQQKDDFMAADLRKLDALHGSLSLATNIQADPMELYVKYFANDLHQSDFIQDLINFCKRCTPAEVIALINAMKSFLPKIGQRGEDKGYSISEDKFVDTLSGLETETAFLIEEAKDSRKPLQSRYNMQNQSLRTTVVAQKVQLSKRESILSKHDSAFTKVIDSLAECMEQYFVFDSPLDLFLHEVWIYDSKSPYREVFTPRPRHAIERALSVPHDYLGCTCCRASSEGMSSSQPPTAILYQLYLETGGLINIFDLWSAFYTIVGGEDGEERDERSALVLFYRALADLKLLGMVKQSRKKTDHLAKLAWKGL